jgi:integrase/recombinase XerC
MSKYRDTTGVSLDSYRNMLAVPDTSKINGLRDYAILHLLWSNALRRAEVVKCDVGDFDFKGRKLRILGKGRNEYEWVELSTGSAIALNIYLDARGDVNQNEPLFISHHAPYTGQRLSDGFVYKMVRETAKKAGIAKAMSPHRVRHSAITTALDATGGDVRSVQKLSRHSNINTLLIYDDNRQNAQGKMSRILGDML